jgi:hypothetical protein
MKRDLISRPFARAALLGSQGLLAPVLLIALAGCASVVAADGGGANTGGVVEVDEEDANLEDQLLELPDLNAFFEALGSSRGKDRAAQASWEAERGFVSMSSIFAKIVDEAESGASGGRVEDHGAPALPLQGSTSLSYSARYAGMLRTGRFGLDMNVTVDDYAKLVNKDGLVKIGDFIYQFTRDRVKAIGGGSSRIPLLKQAQSTNEGLAVWVTRVVVKGRPAGEGPAPGSFSRGCESVSGEHRLIAHEELIEWADPLDPRRIITNYGLKIRSFKGRGTWLLHRTDSLRANGWYEGVEPLGKQSYSFDMAAGVAVSTIRYPFVQDHQVFDPRARPVVRSSEHQVFGAGGTGCAIK